MQDAHEVARLTPPVQVAGQSVSIGMDMTRMPPGGVHRQTVASVDERVSHMAALLSCHHEPHHIDATG